MSAIEINGNKHSENVAKAIIDIFTAAKELKTSDLLVMRALDVVEDVNSSPSYAITNCNITNKENQEI